MRARKAMTGRATKIRQFLTMNSDYIGYPGEADNNGNTEIYHSVVLPDLVRVALPNRTANAMSTAIRWKKAKAWFESRANPGGIKGIKIQRQHHDPGSENKGIMPDTLAEFNVIDSGGGTDIHTDGAFIENAKRTLQTMQASVNYDGIANQPGRFKVGKKMITGDGMLGQRVFGETERRTMRTMSHSKIPTVRG